jgi:DNA-binding NtrC family response regulator
MSKAFFASERLARGWAIQVRGRPRAIPDRRRREDIDLRERDWCIALVRLSESFRTTVGEIAEELRAGIVEFSPEESTSIPLGANVLLVLAGGAEQSAPDVVRSLPAGPWRRFVIGALPDHRIAMSTAHAGAQDYFALPDDLGLLRRLLEREAQEARSRVASSRFTEVERRDRGFDAIIGRSEAMRRTLADAARVAAHRDVTVHVGGETGTGKELLARAIHYHGPRASEPFVEVNCAAIPANLLESELFGYERGAFTGANTSKPGLFELAHGGTLFLDEVAGLPIELQPKLLRALESRTIRRIGGRTTRSIDVRVIAASHQDLKHAVERGEFREDLFYRLNVVSLLLPPLRKRDDDVDLLAETFLVRLATSYGLPVPPLTPEIRVKLRTHRWPGNVRELRNTIERALVLSPPGTLRMSELRLDRESNGTSDGPIPFPAELRAVVRASAHAMLELTGGNKSEAARRLGISRSRMQRLLDGVEEEL